MQLQQEVAIALKNSGGQKRNQRVDVRRNTSVERMSEPVLREILSLAEELVWHASVGKADTQLGSDDETKRDSASFALFDELLEEVMSIRLEMSPRYKRADGRSSALADSIYDRENFLRVGFPIPDNGDQL